MDCDQTDSTELYIYKIVIKRLSMLCTTVFVYNMCKYINLKCTYLAQ